MAVAGENPTFLIKKLGGIFLIILGLLLAGLGASDDSVLLIAVGILSLAAGAILLMLKIARRNQDGPN